MGATEQQPRSRRIRQSTLRIALGVAVVVAVSVPTGLAEKTWSRWTHRIGAPNVTSELPPLSSDRAPSERFGVVGDIGTGDEHARATGRAMDLLEGERPFDALLLLGDNIYPNGDPERIDAAVFEPFGGVLDGDTELVPVLGNHDVRGGFGEAQAAALGLEHPWYSQEFGDVLIVALNSNMPEDAEQLAWLRGTLSASDARWKIAIMHHPPYSGGYHGSSVDVREAFSPLFEEFGVQLVMSGHDHDYQRNQVVGGVRYVVSGGAAKLRGTGRDDFTEVAWSTYHFLDVAIWEDRIEVRAVNQDGRMFDSFEVLP